MDEYYEEEGREQEFNLRDYWMVLLKRKWTIIAFALPLFVVVTIYSFVVRPSYTAKGTLLIEKEPNILTFEEVFQIETFLDDYFQTQFKLLQSRSLANNVIEKLKLDENEKFAGKAMVREKEKREAEEAAAGAADARSRTKLIEKFLRKLVVKPIRQTRLVEVQWKDNDPKFAAEVVNALFDSFIDMNVELKYETTEQATEFLTKQIASLQAEIEEKQREMQKYGAEKNIIALSETETTIIETLGELNRALTEAQIDRLRKEAYYNEIKNASPDNIPDAMTNLLIQRLREDYVRMSREYSKKGETFKPDYPEMQRLKTELESAKRLLENETNNLIKTAYSDYQAALKRERSLSGAYNNQKQEAIQLNSNSIPYNSLKIEIENRKNLLESLIKRESETGVAASLKGLRTSNIRVVDRAEAPLRPSNPKKKLNMLLALLMGLFGGVGLAFLFEHLDDSVKSFQDVEKYAGLPSLGIVPTFSPNGYRKLRAKEAKAGGIKLKVNGSRKSKRKADPSKWLLEGTKEEKEEKKEASEASVEAPEMNSIELITYFSPKSNISENYRSIRTTLLLSAADSKLRCLVVSSPLAQEGKTATISNLAVTFAQAGKRVLIVDSDLRKPRQHKVFKIKNLNGLTNYLSGQANLKDLGKVTQIPNLHLINAGPVPPNPVELLGSEKMGNLIDAMKQYFDYIFFDSPPLLPVSDAVVLGPKIDGVILVVWGGKTTRDALKQAKEKLDMHQIKCAGVILNNISLDEHDYYYMKHYYHYYGQQ